MKWQKIGGYDCYTENGCVKRALIHTGPGERHTGYPYRYDKRLKRWTECVGVKTETLRAGLRRGTYTFR